MSRPTRYFYEKNNTYYYLDENAGQFGEVLAKNKDNKYSYFHLFKDDEPSNEGLLAFKEKFSKCADELYKQGGILYKKYFNHYSATELTFKRYSPNAFSTNFEDVSYDEFEFIEKCFNGGIIYFNEKLKDKSVQSFGYDYSSFYPNILNSTNLLIPEKQGKRVKLKELDFENLKYGIYHMKVTCQNKDFCKIFCFSKKHYYTHYSLEFAYKYRNVFGVKMMLIVGDNIEYNALIYDDDDGLVESNSIFGNWFNKLYIQLKPKCKGNFLLKRLLSSLWGSLTKMEKCYLNEEQALSPEEEGQYVLLNETHRFENGEIITRYEAIKKAKPYKYHYGRLKPFLLAVSRNIIGELIMSAEIIDKVVRIHTDGIVLNEPYDFTKLSGNSVPRTPTAPKGEAVGFMSGIAGLQYYPIPEDKTTGLIKWNNVNSYRHIHE
jgi:hypothetical protein